MFARHHSFALSRVASVKVTTPLVAVRPHASLTHTPHTSTPSQLQTRAHTLNLRQTLSRVFSTTPNKSPFAAHDEFARRHIGVSRPAEVSSMLNILGYKTVDDVINETVPVSIRRAPLQLTSLAPLGEEEALQSFRAIMSKNVVNRTHIGCGYYNTITPPVILRNVIENPGWYTPYTPYQAEIAQGRLEMLLNFQTMVSDLTGLPVSNSSLLDEATAAAEAMYMAFQASALKKKHTFLVADHLHPQTIDVLRTRAAGYGIKLKVLPYQQFDVNDSDVFGAIVQYPATEGNVIDFRSLAQNLHQQHAMLIAASDLLALTVLQPPGEWGADVCVGSAQRFGVPLGYGGPHAGFLSTTEANKRRIPGRIIGVSRDSRGKPALRMAMQTREQHIRRDKATSNICTAQALLANCAAAYAIYHGADGLKRIAAKVHAAATTLATGLVQLGFQVQHQHFFDTVTVRVPNAQQALEAGYKQHINLRHLDQQTVSVSFDETVTAAQINDLFAVFARLRSSSTTALDAEVVVQNRSASFSLPASLQRASPFLAHPVFNMYHSELEMTRYLYQLQMKDLSLCTAMIPLGSCTMKLNATSEMIPITWPSVNGIHPLAPLNQTEGYQQMIRELQRDLAAITGFDAVSLQPNAGSQGEYAGLLAIKQYHVSRGDTQRNVCLIPTSAHGTNPASAAMLNFKIVVVACDEKGNVDVTDLKAKLAQHSNNVSALMITYPSTHGVFEEEIKEIIKLVHASGGQVYMDGANLNAQVGLTSPGTMGADVCHMNLHKTFCIPHGGGGPGMGPIGVKAHLAPFLPQHVFLANNNNLNDPNRVGAVAAAPFSSASILPISYMYIKMMGAEGLTHATKMAIVNANYMRKRLSAHYKVLFTGSAGNCAHEFIIDLRDLKHETGITEEDVAKRLQDFNFHAPTMSFPVVGTLMIEPTESESLYELDRFCDAMIVIRKEIEEVATGKQDKINNTLKNAPHTHDVVSSDKWDRPYPREKAAYPVPSLRANKFWPSVGRIDNVFGDRNVICTCPPLEAYADQN